MVCKICGSNEIDEKGECVICHFNPKEDEIIFRDGLSVVYGKKLGG